MITFLAALVLLPLVAFAVFAYLAIEITIKLVILCALASLALTGALVAAGLALLGAQHPQRPQ